MSSHRPKTHAAFALLLIGVCAQALAQNGRNAAADGNGACPQVSEAVAVETARPAAPASASATRAKYATPSSTPAARSQGGGGDGDGGGMPRSQGSKWHSFLPGMFR